MRKLKDKEKKELALFLILGGILIAIGVVRTMESGIRLDTALVPVGVAMMAVGVAPIFKPSEDE